MRNVWNIHHILGRQQYYLMIKRSSGAKAKVCVYADSVLCVGQMKDSPEAIEDGEVKWKDSGCIRLTKKEWESMEKQLNSSGQISRVFIIVYSSRDPKRLGGKEHSTRRVQVPDHLYVNVQ